MSGIKCQMQQDVDGAEFSIGHIFVFAGEETPDDWPCQCGQELYNSEKSQLTQANQRIAELEKLLNRAYGDFPCDHDPESDPRDNPKCNYCKLFVEIGEALQEEEKLR